VRLPYHFLNRGWKAAPTTRNAQRATRNAQRTTHNAQRATRNHPFIISLEYKKGEKDCAFSPFRWNARLNLNYPSCETMPANGCNRISVFGGSIQLDNPHISITDSFDLPTSI